MSPKLHSASPIALRQLTPVERATAFAKAGYESGVYIDTVREMEGGCAYSLTLNGLPATALKRRLNRAAEELGLKLRWAPARRTATELVVELIG